MTPCQDSRGSTLLAQETEEWEPSSNSNSFSLTRLGDLLSEEPEEISFVYEDTLPAGGMSILVAKPKVGKSTFGRNLALAVSRGDEFLGRKTAQGPVVYLALEEKRTQVQDHFRRMGVVDGFSLRATWQTHSPRGAR